MDKELLLTELCTRLPYELIVETLEGPLEYDVLTSIDIVRNSAQTLYDGYTDNIEKFIPYLRPWSDMTEKEKQEFYDICTTSSADKNHFIMEGCIDSNHMLEKFDWLNRHHIDYRNSIGKVAKRAPKDMYYNVYN